MIIKSIKKRIKEYFFVSPTEKLRLRQIERAVKVPFPSVVKYVKELEKEGILKDSKISGVKFYNADRSSNEFLLEKKLFNIKSVFYSGLVNHLIKECNNPLIILFGSYSKGEDIEKSDIDIYIETSNNKKAELNKFENILKRRIQIFNFKSLDKIPNKELSNNILNGIVLNGYLEVFK